MKKFMVLVVFISGITLLSAAEEKLVWPAPPDEAKIEYVTSIQSSKDLGIKKGFFSKVVDYLFGQEDTALIAPFGVYADNNRVYTTDIAAKALYIFDTKKNDFITVNGSKKENFLYPISVVADKGGNIFVSDSVRAKIYVFKKNGNFNYEIKLDILQRPVGLAISGDGEKLYVVDTVASQIHVLSLKGEFIGSIGRYGSGDGEFNRPTFIDVGVDGKLYVADSMNHRIQILNKDGGFIHKFGQLGQEIGSFGSPRGVSVDSDGNIYVSDTMFNNIQIFNQDGELLMVLGNFGSLKGEFSLPEDISIAPNNTIYIADINNNRIQVFRLIQRGKR